MRGSGTSRGTSTGYGQQDTEFDVPPVTTYSPESAYLRVLAQGGAMPWRRDAADQRVVGTVREQTGQIIDSPDEVGGYPELESEDPPPDADNDGMPNYWEQAMGLNPDDPADGNETDPSGYTMLENYLNWLADGHGVVNRNGSVDVDLQTLNGGLDGLEFTVKAGSHGTVTLLGDGHTARFTPASDYSGLADFTYTVTDSATGFDFGPVQVGVLVKATAG